MIPWGFDNIVTLVQERCSLQEYEFQCLEAGPLVEDTTLPMLQHGAFVEIISGGRKLILVGLVCNVENHPELLLHCPWCF